ncbi:uncharacterized protein LOC135845812 [Planococcus citri]|uniref:uncharacterized protein LOC135845812 n=1 Tax=Planococcus citri TaxID=170843 RepID=UPI0031F954A0
MGNWFSTSQNGIPEPDTLIRIGSDAVEMAQRSRFDLTLIGENESVYPRSLFGFLNWWFSIPKSTFCFDSLKLDKSSRHCQSLTNEIKEIVENIAVTEEEAERIVSNIKNDLVKAFRNPDAIRLWQCYGSYRDGLCIRNSNVDLYFGLDNRDDSGFLSGTDQETIHRRIEQLLQASPAFTKVRYIQTARVPIFKMYHRASGNHVDISTNPTSITNTELMKFYVLTNRNVKYLTLFLKKVLSRYGLHGTNRFTTTILFWLVVFFMQKMDLLPSVFEARKLRRKIEHYDGWDHSVPNIEGTNSTTDFEDLFPLFLNFLKFYKEFGFSQYVICPLIGREIPIHSFKNLQFEHPAFNVYVEKLRQRKINGFPISYINLQDPTIHCNNLGEQTGRCIFNSFKIFCHHLYENFTTADGCETEVLEDCLPSSRLSFRSLRVENNWYWLTQCCTETLSLTLRGSRNSQESLNPRRVIINAIRAVMEDILSFNCDYIVPMNGDMRKNNDEDVSYTYFQLSASAKTWQNPFICRIFNLSGIPRDINVAQLSNSIYIVKISATKKGVKLEIMMESNQYLHTFFISSLRAILTTVLKQGNIIARSRTYRPPIVQQFQDEPVSIFPDFDECEAYEF